MKSLLIVLLLFFAAFNLNLEAQSRFGKQLDLNVYGGYAWGDYYNAYYAEVKVGATGYWGAALSLSIDRGFSGELHYQNLRPVVSIRPYKGYDIQEDQVELSSNWMLIGSLAEKQISKPLSLFGYMGVGAVYSVPVSSVSNLLSSYKETWALGVALQGGFKYMISDKIGLRGFAALNMPMQFGGTGFYLGTGGSGLSLNSYTSVFLFNLGGGLIYRIM